MSDDENPGCLPERCRKTKHSCIRCHQPVHALVSKVPRPFALICFFLQVGWICCFILFPLNDVTGKITLTHIDVYGVCGDVRTAESCEISNSLHYYKENFPSHDSVLDFDEGPGIWLMVRFGGYVFLVLECVLLVLIPCFMLQSQPDSSPEDSDDSEDVNERHLAYLSVHTVIFLFSVFFLAHFTMAYAYLYPRRDSNALSFLNKYCCHDQNPGKEAQDLGGIWWIGLLAYLPCSMLGASYLVTTITYQNGREVSRDSEIQGAGCGNAACACISGMIFVVVCIAMSLVYIRYLFGIFSLDQLSILLWGHILIHWLVSFIPAFPEAAEAYKNSSDTENAVPYQRMNNSNRNVVVQQQNQPNCDTDIQYQRMNNSNRNVVVQQDQYGALPPNSVHNQGLPPGWQAFSNQGRVYWVDHHNKISTYYDPRHTSSFHYNQRSYGIN